jgi:hypothetical protein
MYRWDRSSICFRPSYVGLYAELFSVSCHIYGRDKAVCGALRYEYVRRRRWPLLALILENQNCFSDRKAKII